MGECVNETPRETEPGWLEGVGERREMWYALICIAAPAGMLWHWSRPLRSNIGIGHGQL